MTLTFIGHGYVGLVTAAVFADLGNKVYVIGHTPKKIEDLKKGIIPFFEPGLEELVKKNYEAGRLIFTLDYAPGVPDSEIVFIAVGTPPQKTGDAELYTVFEVAKKIGENLKPGGYTVVATKSTVPPGTNKKIARIVEESKSTNSSFDIASVPEFLREGTAISDTLNPDRVVIGTESSKARQILVDLHKPLIEDSDSHKAFIVDSNLETAELIKYASNSFLATKISFANAIAKLSELCGADGLKVLEGIGYDKRIGRDFLSPGAGYGGSCFPKDVKALVSIAADYGYDFSLLNDVEGINKQAKRDIVRKARAMTGDLRGKTVAVLGLAFKPNTDDMREAPAIDIIELLKKEGALIKVFDPQATANAKEIIRDIEYSDDLYDAVKDAEVLIIVTEWNEFKEADLEKIKSLMMSPNIIDGRNIYDPSTMKNLGFSYEGTGR
ncbi:MAG: UDP-glucose/GDP-mannose dehydrogenase family protein [Candidatus Levybacteria bacterium]|nr:UDP-glucose/GDP-mannose dehydrogenase family protein [Candidatus Levybacteria bacterium]